VFSLLARQFGEIVKALKAPVRSPTDSNTLYRESKIEEQPLPSDPNVTLRRTVIDEVIVTGKNPNDETRNPNQ
jgi:hypothetical protein